MEKYAASESNEMMILSFITALSYLIMGLMQIAFAFTPSTIPLVPGDPIIGFILVLLSTIFFTGTYHYVRKSREAFAFLAIGMIIAGIVFALHIITLLTNMLGWIIQFSDWQKWSISSDIAPAVWLYPIFGILFLLLNHRNGLNGSVPIMEVSN